MAPRTMIQVREIAKAILRDKRQGSSFPISLRAIAENEYLEIEPLNTRRKFEGRLELTSGKPSILLNTVRVRWPHSPRSLDAMTRGCLPVSARSAQLPTPTA